jgi:hypothetical protein
MLYADGELGEEDSRRVSAFLAEDASARTKVESVRQVGDAVRTYLELESDAAESDIPAFAGLWDRIERRIHSNGAAAEPGRAASRAAGAPARDLRGREPVREAGGILAAVRRWFEGHRGHILTGAVSAGAVAALMLAISPRERIIERQVVNGGGALVGGGTPAALQSQPPEVEGLEVYEGSGTILTIEPEGDDDSAAAVIWISRDDDSMEDPI